MSKTPSSKLFDLIKSLSGSEKRYFKLHINKTNGDTTNKYIQLFDAIDRQETFDDLSLQKFIYKNEAIQSRKYSELKSYLYNQILKALQGFDEKSSIDYRLKGMLQSVRVLYKRGHYNDCKELLAKTKKLALKYEDFISLLEILRWDKQIAYTQIDVTYMNKELAQIDKEEKHYLAQLQNHSEFKNLFYHLLTSVKKNAFPTIEKRNAFISKLMDNPLLAKDYEPLSFKAKILYYRIQTVSAYAQAKSQKFHQESKYLLALMESKPYLLKEDLSEYISVLSNYMLSCIHLANFKEWESCLDKFLKIKPQNIDDEIKIHRQYHQGKFAWCMRTGEFEEGRSVIEAHLEKIKQFDNTVFERSVFYYTYFYIYFGVGDFDKALDYLNQWLDLPRTVEQQTYQISSRILNLIIHFEMGNTILLESLLRSTYRFLHKAEQLTVVERNIITFIRNSTNIFTKKEQQEYYLALQEKFQDVGEKRRLGFFDFEAWLESKITNKNFSDVIKEKHQRSLLD